MDKYYYLLIKVAANFPLIALSWSAQLIIGEVLVFTLVA